MHEHQSIPTDVTLSKVSDLCFIMEVYENFLEKYFKVDLFERNEECVKINVAEKYYKIEWSELRCNISTLNIFLQLVWAHISSFPLNT